MPPANQCYLTIWSEHFLGTAERCHAFLDLLPTLDRGQWTPQKWGHYEPIRTPYRGEERDAVVRAWTEERPAGTGRSHNSILFSRRAPRAMVHLSTWRNQVPALNRLSIDLDAQEFLGADGVERLVAIMLTLSRWGDAAYATLLHSRQAHKRSVGGNPLDRLQRLDWLTFFGPPYVSMFGRSHLLETPCHRVQEVLDGVLLMATPRPDDPAMTDSAELLLRLEAYLGPTAFAGYGYPQTPCRVPLFNLGETVVTANNAATAPRPH